MELKERIQDRIRELEIEATRVTMAYNTTLNELRHLLQEEEAPQEEPSELPPPTPLHPAVERAIEAVVAHGNGVEGGG